MAIVATIIRLNCRIVVLETLFVIGFKSAKNACHGLFVVSLVLADFYSTTKALFSQSILAKALEGSIIFI